MVNLGIARREARNGGISKGTAKALIEEIEQLRAERELYLGKARNEEPIPILLTTGEAAERLGIPATFISLHVRTMHKIPGLNGYSAVGQRWITEAALPDIKKLHEEITSSPKSILRRAAWERYKSAAQSRMASGNQR